MIKLVKAAAAVTATAVLTVSVNAIDWWDDDRDDYYWGGYDTEEWHEHTAEGFYYVVNSDGTVAVTGYEQSDIRRLEIPEQLDGQTVTGIYDAAFHWFMELKTVVIPDSVTQIGSSAFSGCAKLEEVTLSKNIREIRYNCFYSCVSLKKIEIPDGVTSIESGAFGGCYALEEVRIPASVKDIPYGTFVGCENLTVYCRRGSEAARYFEDIGERYGISCVLEAPSAEETAMVLGIVAAAWGVVILVIIIGVAAARKREKKDDDQEAG